MRITEQLARFAEGDDTAFLPEMYTELAAIAAAHTRRLGPRHSLDVVGVVGEAWLRLSASHPERWPNRATFFGYASRVMRFIVADYFRSRSRQKRGGGTIRIEFDLDTVAARTRDVRFEELDECLERLRALDARAADVVEMRFYAGMTIDEVAEALNISVSSVKRDTAAGEAWIRGELSLR